MYAVFKINGKVHLEYCYLTQNDGLYTFIDNIDDKHDTMYFINKKDILGYGEKEDLLTQFAEHFI